MKRFISLRSSLACAISAAVLFNAVPSIAADDSAGSTINQTTPVDATQRDRNISQPNSFGEDPAERSDSMENRTTSDDSYPAGSDTTSNQSGIVGTDQPSDVTRGALVDSADGSRQIQLSTGESQLQPVAARSLVDRKVVNSQNKPIGEVEEVVNGPNGIAALVVEAGGFMGIGEKEVLIPVDEVRLSGNQLIWESQMDAAQLKDSQQYHYEDDRYSSLSDD
jgi:RimM protein, required for 16S rRNA processing